MDVLHYFSIPFRWRSTLNDLLQYHTYVDVLKYVFVNVHSDHTSPWMVYHKHHIYQDVLQVGIGAPSDYPVQRTISYKHQTHMNILNYVCADVSSEDAAPWMIYYKHLKDTDVLHCVCTDVCKWCSTLKDLLHTSQVCGLSPVYTFMQIQSILLLEWLITNITVIHTFSNMSALVHLQIALFTEWFITNVTGIWTFLIMYAMMFRQTTLYRERFITNITGIWTFSTMYALMNLQSTLPKEWLITNIARIWTFSTMHALMCLQVTLHSEWLITNITGIWTFSTMRALMYLQTTL